VTKIGALNRAGASVVGSRRWQKARSVTATGVVASLVAAAFTAQAAQSASAAPAGPELSVDVSAARHAISPDIYGLNWNTTLEQDGTRVVAGDAGWNGSAGAGGSANFGFQATGAAAAPALTCTPT
jgi:hypothetical protein